MNSIPKVEVSSRTRRRRGRGWLIALVVVVALFVLALVLLDPIVEWQVRRAEAQAVDQGYDISHEDVWVNPFTLSGGITGLDVKQINPDGDREPFVTVESANAGLAWGQLFRGRLVADVEVESPRVEITADEGKEVEAPEVQLPAIDDQLEKLPAMRVARVAVKDLQVEYHNSAQPEFPDIRVHDMDITVENMATRKELYDGQPVTVAVSGRAQESGEVSAFVTADPLRDKLWFEGRAQVEKLQLDRFSEVLSSETGVAVSKGTLEVFIEFHVEAGQLSGGVKPIIKDPEVVQAKPGIGNWFKAAVANTGISVLSDRVKDRNAVATTIPITGDLTSPDIQLYPAILGVIRNAFVLGVSASYDWLPPPKESDNPVTKAAKALDPSEEPPAASPEGGQ